MKRKLFSAILFGALLTASTSGLTSCKDYDDDIQNLQSQIDKLATADQLNAKVSEMQAAISSAKSEATEVANKAKEAADAAKQAAEAAATKADVEAAKTAAIDAANKAVEDASTKAAEAVGTLTDAIAKAQTADQVKTAIDAALVKVNEDIAANTAKLTSLEARLKSVEDKLAAIEAGEGEGSLAEIQLELEAIDAELVAIIGEYSSMVTDVDLAITNGNAGGNFNNVLSFIYVAQEKTTVFPKDDVADAQIEFSDSNKDITTTDSLLVRVSPTNAVLNAANVSLINSQGKDLSEFIEVSSVKPYTKLITSRGASEGNGLWNVEFKVKDNVDRAKLAEAIVSGGKSVKFAVAVKNTELSEDVRRVISAYNVSAMASTYEPARSAFQATNRDGKWFDVSEIHNRYYYNAWNDYGVSTGAESTTVKTQKGVAEYRWDNEPQIAGNTSELVNADNDARSHWKPIEVAVGQPIDISVATVLDASGNPSYSNNVGGLYSGDNAGFAIKAFYVTLDKEAFAIESAPSEWVAWTKYNYTNVGVPGTSTKATLFYGNNGSITINSAEAINDIIGFRVYAVNLDGTLVDPDGRAFYVRIAREKQYSELTGKVLEATLNYNQNNNTYSFKTWYDGGVLTSNYQSAPIALNANVLSGAANVAQTRWEIIENPSEYGNNVVKPVYGTDYTISYKDTNWDGKDDAAVVTLLEPQKFLDGATYTAAATFLNSNGTEVRDVTVQFKKVMPTVAPSLGWASGFDPMKQVFANTTGTNIYKISAGSTPQAIELDNLMNKLTYGNGGDLYSSTESYYRMTFKNILMNNWTTNDINVPADGVALPANTGRYGLNPNKYLLGVEMNSIDGQSHEVSYTFDCGEISMTKDYTTGNFKTSHCIVPGPSTLALKFASWIDYESIEWVKAPELTFKTSVSPGSPDTKTNVPLLGGTTTVGTGIYKDLSNNYWKPISNGDYYKVAQDSEGNYKFVNNATPAAILNNQTEDNVKANGQKLADGATITEVKKNVTTSSNLVAYNDVVSNYDANGKSIFGTSAKKVDFSSLMGVYVNNLEVYTDHSAYWVHFDNATSPTQLVFEQQGTSVNPTNDAKIYLSGYDCFGHKKTWVLKYTIKN